MLSNAEQLLFLTIYKREIMIRPGSYRLYIFYGEVHMQKNRVKQGNRSHLGTPVHATVWLERGDIGLGCPETLQSNLYNEWLSLALRWLVTLFARQGSIHPALLQTSLPGPRGEEEAVEDTNTEKKWDVFVKGSRECTVLCNKLNQE